VKTYLLPIHNPSLTKIAGTNLIVFCASIYAVKELLGYKSISTQIYFHLQQKKLEDAISLLEI